MLNRDAVPEYQFIPAHTLDTIDNYVNDGTPVGGFLEAVLVNNLMEAMGRADEWNRAALFDICSYIYNETPGNCHGSPKIYQDWLNAKAAERSDKPD